MTYTELVHDVVKQAIKDRGYAKRITRFDHEKDLNYAQVQDDPSDNRMIKLKDTPKVSPETFKSKGE